MTIQGSFIGEKRSREQVGQKGRGSLYWNECPDCGNGSWVRKLGTRCQRCNGKIVMRNLKKWWEENHHEGCKCARCCMKDQKGPKNHSWSGGVTYRNGYRFIKIYEDDPMFIMAKHNGYAMEHRLIVARSIGRPLFSTETVHHKNGIRDDNRIDNLELWIGNHTSRQRLEDAIKHAFNILNQYRPDLIKEGGKL